MSWTFGGKYKLDSELGVGGCGSVYSGVHTVAGKEVAIKLEPAIPHPSHPTTHSASGSTPLQQESRIYKTLQGGPGVPWMMWSGKKDGYNVMVIDLLGPSLEDLFRRCNKHFSLKTVLLLADQMVSSSNNARLSMRFRYGILLLRRPSPFVLPLPVWRSMTDAQLAAYTHRVHPFARTHSPGHQAGEHPGR